MVFFSRLHSVSLFSNTCSSNKIQPNPLNFHHFTQWIHLWWWCSKFQGGVAANGADLRSKLIFLRTQGSGAKDRVVGHQVLSFKGSGRGLTKKRHLSWMRRFVHTPAYHSWRTMSRLYEETNLNCQNASDITSIYCKSKTPRTGTHEFFYSEPLRRPVHSSNRQKKNLPMLRLTITNRHVRTQSDSASSYTT